MDYNLFLFPIIPKPVVFRIFCVCYLFLKNDMCLGIAYLESQKENYEFLFAYKYMLCNTWHCLKYAYI